MSDRTKSIHRLVWWDVALIAILGMALGFFVFGCADTDESGGDRANRADLRLDLKGGE